MTIKIADGIVLDDRDVKERFVRAMGTDGQNANRAATAVELRLDINASSLPDEIKQRLVATGGRHVTRDGVLIVVSRKYRTQVRNRDAARKMLGDVVRSAAAESAPPAREYRRSR